MRPPGLLPLAVFARSVVEFGCTLCVSLVSSLFVWCAGLCVDCGADGGPWTNKNNAARVGRHDARDGDEMSAMMAFLSPRTPLLPQCSSSGHMSITRGL
eukprot:8200938-Lingulodinium_polyedra.AAC.1